MNVSMQILQVLSSSDSSWQEMKGDSSHAEKQTLVHNSRKRGQRAFKIQCLGHLDVCRQHTDLMAAAHGMEPQGAVPTRDKERSSKRLPADPVPLRLEHAPFGAIKSCFPISKPPGKTLLTVRYIRQGLSCCLGKEAAPGPFSSHHKNYVCYTGFMQSKGIFLLTHI